MSYRMSSRGQDDPQDDKDQVDESGSDNQSVVSDANEMLQVTSSSSVAFF